MPFLSHFPKPPVGSTKDMSDPTKLQHIDSRANVVKEVMPGDLPQGPMAYIIMPTYRPASVEVCRRDPSLHRDADPVTVTATARHGDGSYSSKAQPCHPAGGPERRLRYERHHETSKGWRSKYHPKTLDYRTVDELGLTIAELDEHKLPRTTVVKQQAEALVDEMIVEGAELLQRQAGSGMLNPSISLLPGRPVFGEVKPVAKKTETQYSFYTIDVPDLDIPVGLKVQVTAISGDPDVYVCNRNTFPMMQPHEHTWKSQFAGDDVVEIPPHDPSFYPGPFYISVFSLRDAQFEVTATFVEQRVRIRPAMPSQGNGYKEVRQQLALADTRRRFCKHGAGFKEQLDSPRSLHGSAPRPGSISPRNNDSTGPRAARAAQGHPILTPHPPSTGRPQTAPDSVSYQPESSSAAPPTSVSALPISTRQALLSTSVRAATPRSRPESLFFSTMLEVRDKDDDDYDDDYNGAPSPAAAATSGRSSPLGGGSPRAQSPVQLQQQPISMAPMPPQRPVTAPGAPHTPRSARLATQFEPTEALEGSTSPKDKDGRGSLSARHGSEMASAYLARIASQSARGPRTSTRSAVPGSAPLSGLSRVVKDRTKRGDAQLSELEKLARFDEGGDVLSTVRNYIAAQSNVSTDVIDKRDHISVDERVRLNLGEFRGVQNLLTHRLRRTLATQDDARLNAYRFRAKASQHLDITAAENWSPARALSLINSESLRIKDDYDQRLAEHFDEIAHRQAEARNAQDRLLARQKLRSSFSGAQASVRMLKMAEKARGRGGGHRRNSLVGAHHGGSSSRRGSTRSNTSHSPRAR